MLWSKYGRPIVRMPAVRSTGHGISSDSLIIQWQPAKKSARAAEFTAWVCDLIKIRLNEPVSVQRTVWSPLYLLMT
jgi:hypothetical protein